MPHRQRLIAWTAYDSKTGDKFLAVFNATEADSAKISVRFEQLGIKRTCKVTDLWSHKDLGDFKGEFAPVIIRHGSGLYRISLKK